VIGRSLGSGIAMHLAAVRPVHKLVLVTPYDSVLNVAQAYLSMFPVSWLLRDRYDSLSRAAHVRIPILVLLAADDRVIPRAHSERLIAAFPAEQAAVRIIASTSHDSIAAAPDYGAALATFLLADAR
jgi:pimeloyl-ACP methyl ester carboxylesterase